MTLLKHGDLKQIAADNGWSDWLVRAVNSGHRKNDIIKKAIAAKTSERLHELADEIKEEATNDRIKTAQ